MSGPQRVLLLGATGTIGAAAARALVARGHDTLCLLRPGRDGAGLPPGTHVRTGDVTGAKALAAALAGERIDAVISCLASRSGAPADAWAVDHRANVHALVAAKAAGARRFVLLSAICVQRPRLAFQHAKLAFERELMASRLDWAIVRPTAYFKSLSGQIDRLRAGKPFLVFGDGRLTACKPIGADDLGAYLVDCLDDPARTNRVLPIGGPGPALTPRDIGEGLFTLLGRAPRFRHVPVTLLDTIVSGLSTLGRVSPRLADRAEFARIGRYYATESMLMLDPATGRYDAAATPSTGTERLIDYQARLIAGETADERDAHAVF